jgi:hypothetical protein
MFLIFCRKFSPRVQIYKSITMPARTSTRQAAVKANQAFGQGAGTKRKGPASSHLPPKKGKKDLKPNEENNYEKPSVTEEAQEIRFSEDPTQAQATVNKQPTEAPPKRAEEPVQKDIVVEEKPEPAADGEDLSSEPKYRH